MNSVLMNDIWHRIDLRWAAVSGSLIITLLTIVFPDTPNDDAYIYIRTAEIYLAEGMGAAFQHYAWAGYSLLIATVSRIGFSLINAAYLVNGLFYALLVYSFLSLLRQIDSSRLVMLMGVLVVLLYPQLNEYRYQIIRDVGFWAFALFALWQFLRYMETADWRNALAYCLALLLAAGFRAEAVVYLLVTPLSLLFDSRYTRSLRLGRFYRLLAITLASLLAAVLLLALAGVNIAALFVEFFSVYEPFVNNTFSPSEAATVEAGRALFGAHASAYSQEYIILFLATGLLAILAANLFNGIGGPFFWLLVYGAFKRDIGPTRPALLPIIAYLLVNAVILFVFLFVTRYLTSRYAMVFCLLLALLVPLVLARIAERIQASSHAKVGTRALILFFAYCGFDSFISFGDSKDFVYESADWIVARSEPGGALLTNNHAIAYFSGKVENYDQTSRFIDAADIRATRVDDLVALEMHFEMEQLMDTAEMQRLLQFEVAFPDDQDRQIAIYRRVDP